MLRKKNYSTPQLSVIVTDSSIHTCLYFLHGNDESSVICSYQVGFNYNNVLVVSTKRWGESISLNKVNKRRSLSACGYSSLYF